jgi:hypothetical protein
MEEDAILYTPIPFQLCKSFLNQCNVPKTSSEALPTETHNKKLSANSSCSLPITNHTYLTISDTINQKHLQHYELSMNATTKLKHNNI